MDTNCKINSLAFKGFYNSKILKKGLEFAAGNGSLFAAGTTLILSSAVRPAVILAAPKTDKKNKELACAKSISSSIVGYLLMLGASLPLARSIKNIDNSPEKYLKNVTVAAFKSEEKVLGKSNKYIFATQLFKLGLGFIIAVPKSILTCAFIPPILSKIFPNKSESHEPLNQFTGRNSHKNINFTGLLKNQTLSKQIGKLLDTKFIQNLSDRFKDSNFAMHIMALTDALATGTLMWQIKRSQKIEEKRKKTLIYNSGISTGLSIAAGYALDKLLNKPTEKFIAKFKEVNKDSAKLDKYIEGIRVAKPVLILGGIYYIVIPFISTLLADRFKEKS